MTSEAVVVLHGNACTGLAQGVERFIERMVAVSSRFKSILEENGL